MRSVSVFRVELLVRCKKLTMFNILSNEHMEVGGNVCFDYFTNVFKIHFGEICHLAITAVNFHNKDGSFPCKMVCRSERPTNAVIETCMAFLSPPYTKKNSKNALTGRVACMRAVEENQIEEHLYICK